MSRPENDSSLGCRQLWRATDGGGRLKHIFTFGGADTMTFHRTAAVLLMAAVFLLGPGRASATETFGARVVNVRDGDTITVVRENLDMVDVRLYGIDAPESGQAYGQKAARHLKKLVYKKVVLIEPQIKKDRYGRTVAIVRLEDQDINREMVRAGYAWVYADYCKRRRPCGGYWKAVHEAIDERRGLWRTKGRAEPPWEWRKRNKNKKIDKVDLPGKARRN